MIPAMREEGYHPDFAAAVASSGGTLGILIPPSVGLVIYGIITEVSIGKLFLAGAIPGVIMGLYMLVVCYLVARRADLPQAEKTSPARAKSTRPAIPAPFPIAIASC